MDKKEKDILKIVAGIDGIPKKGAYNIRIDGAKAARASTANIEIRNKENGKGIEIRVKPFTQNETCHIPVVVGQSGMCDVVENDFYIGEGADVSIVAGCGIHNDGVHLTAHDGIHSFYIGKGAKVLYTEKHYGQGNGSGARVLNPVTRVFLDDGAALKMETVQIEGVDSTKRETTAELKNDARLTVKEKLMTSGKQTAVTRFSVKLNGENSKADILSRSVAKGNSVQAFHSMLAGNSACTGHSECDAIIMDAAVVSASPKIEANHVDASLIHEAVIGKIAGEQLIKLMSLGLSEKEAEQEIIKGFLR